jgi:RND superfamily putative drug exporter
MPWSSRIGALSARAPRGVLITTAIAVLVTLAIALPQLDRLSGAITTDPATESARAADAVEHATGHASEPAFFVLVSGGSGADAATTLASRTKRVQRILKREDRVALITRGDQLLAQSGPTGSAPPTGIPTGAPPDHAFISVTLDTPQGDGRTDAAMRRLIDALADVPGVQLGGTELVTHEVTSTIAEDLHHAELVIIPILLLLTLLFFRSVAAALVPVVIAGVATLLTMLALVVATYVTSISNFALNLTTALAMGLGIDYGLLLVSRFREELATGSATRDAVARTLATAGHAVMFSAATVGASMASLLVFPQSYIKSIGIAGVLVALVSGLAALIVVPALLTLLGPNIDAISPKWMQRRASRTRTIEQGAWYRLTMVVSRHAGIVMVLATLLVVFFALPARQASFTLADETVLPKDSPARTAIHDATQEFPVLSTPTAGIVLTDTPGQPAAAKVAAQAMKIVGERGAVGVPVRLDADTWLIDVRLQHRAVDDRSLELARDLRRGLPSRALVQGLGPVLLDARSSIFGHAPLALAIVVAATMLFILVLTGSIVLAVKTVIMNALTLSAMFGVLVWVFQEGHWETALGFTSQGGLEVGQPMIVCALVFGLSTDYGVFLLARVKESYDAGNDTTTALAIGTERTGRVITTAALLFCVAMGVSAASRLVTVKQVGFGVAFAVLLDATLVRGVLVPATMQVLGRWNWWAPGPLKRLAERSQEH